MTVENFNCNLNPNQNQKNLLNKFMNLHKELAEGTIENTPMGETLWGQLTQFLNFVGPPYQSCTEWRMYWNYVKGHVMKVDVVCNNSKLLNKKETIPIEPTPINSGQSSKTLSPEILTSLNTDNNSKVIQKPITANKRPKKSRRISSKTKVKKKNKNLKSQRLKRKDIKYPKKAQSKITSFKKVIKRKPQIPKNNIICQPKSNQKSIRKPLKINKPVQKRKNITTKNFKKIKDCKLKIPKKKVPQNNRNNAVKSQGKNLRKKRMEKIREHVIIDYK